MDTLDESFCEKLSIEKAEPKKNGVTKSSKKGSRSDPAPEVHYWKENTCWNCSDKTEKTIDENQY